MHVALHPPPAPLAPFIEWIWEQSGPATPHPAERVVPSGTLELIVSLRDEPIGVVGAQAVRVAGSILCGAQSGSIVIDSRQPRRLVGVHFRPGGAWPFVGEDVDAYSDAFVSAELVWGPARMDRLRERLSTARSASARIALLSEFLMERFDARGKPGHPAVAAALRALDRPRAGNRIGSLAAETGLSERRFVELFRREVGLTPKRFERMRRLQALLARLDAVDGTSWSARALAHGYFDQPHLIRDFQAFAGCSPGGYRPLGGGQINHVALTEPGVEFVQDLRSPAR